MAFLVGTDEAGYGPNLGPLVISATVWQVPDRVRAEDLYGRLGDVVAGTPGQAASVARRASTTCSRVAIADSKMLYQSGGSLRRLERGLLAALALLGHRPNRWRQVWDALAPESARPRREIPWYADYDAPVPIDTGAEEIEPPARALAAGLAAADVRLAHLRSRAVFPGEFNLLVDQHGTKAAALSHATLELVAELTAALDAAPISIRCDKHGGRNRYGRLLEEHFPGPLIEIYGESRNSSVYHFGPEKRRVEIRFQRKGESCLPVALASMASKYLRELAMRAFNTFWCSRVAGLRPTAGYPQDAKRFKAAIAAAQAELAIDDALLWRKR